MSFISSLQEFKREAQAVKDPWRLRLEGLRGKKWDDGIERISTQTIFDILEVPTSIAVPLALAVVCRSSCGNSAGARSRREDLLREDFGPSARICERHDRQTVM